MLLGRGELNADVLVHPGYFAWEEERRRLLYSSGVRSAILRLADQFSVTISSKTWGNWKKNYFFLKPDELDLSSTGAVFP